jgi:transposase
LGLTLRAEIGDATRFNGGPALASYAGLVPRVESSGERVYHGRITRQGSPWIRWALVEARNVPHLSRPRNVSLVKIRCPDTNAAQVGVVGRMRRA